MARFSPYAPSGSDRSAGGIGGISAVSEEENEDDEESDPEEELDEEYEYEVFPEDVVPVTVGFGASPGGTCAPYSGTFTVAPSAAPAARSESRGT
jgi:hypothetical protein